MNKLWPLLFFLALIRGEKTFLENTNSIETDTSSSTDAIAADILQGGKKKEYFQAHLPSAIVIAMDIPAWGLV
jgi:hypothetical protein